MHKQLKIDSCWYYCIINTSLNYTWPYNFQWFGLRLPEEKDMTIVITDWCVACGALFFVVAHADWEF